MIDQHLHGEDKKLMDYLKSYESWCNDTYFDNDTREELFSINNDDIEIKDRFHKELSFGTGGLRGLIGAGTNRINVYTIRKATQGLANFIRSTSTNKTTSSVAIAYDSRHFSDVFAEEAALILASNDIKAFVFKSLRSTPELSFAVRYLNCDAGIVITASHNPAEFNGFKVYGSDGGQITLNTADAIISEIGKIDTFNDVKTCNKVNAIEKGLLSYIGENVDIEYLKRVIKLSVNPNISKLIKDFKIVYTPLHGTGLVPIVRALAMLGYNDVNIVESQKEPDGNFPTVKSPNPEERDALGEGIKLAESIKADLVLGTDPDSDRVGVAVRTRDGEYALLTGNQIGALLVHYIVSNKKGISSRETVIKTIVTSELGASIARSYGATVIDTLTGFKFIGEKIKEFEVKKNHDFLFGYEESYGYLAGTFVRDKDAIISSVLIVEMAAFYKLKNKTLKDAIDDIYKEYGYYTDALDSFTFKGIDGQDKINSIVDKFRNTEALFREFPNVNIVEDYESQMKLNNETAQSELINLPSSNVIKIHLTDQSWFAVRPSGTEPKLKIYYSTIGILAGESTQRMNLLKEKIRNLINC